jgi:hypothetical protein
LFTGEFWFIQLTFGHKLQPQLPTLDKPFEPVALTPDDLEAKKRYDIDHRTIGSGDEPLDGRSAI